jgi:hypothetical protein
MEAQRGDWTKETGGDGGIFYDGHRWLPFECVGCMHACGLINPLARRGGESFAMMQRILRDRAHNHNYMRHNRVIHNAWLAAGKPIIWRS